MCCKHSNDVARQLETPGNVISFLAQQMYLVAQHNLPVVFEVTLCHDWKIKCCNRCIFNLTACEILGHAATFLLHLSGIL